MTHDPDIAQPALHLGRDVAGVQSPPMRYAYMGAVVEFLAKSGLRGPLRILEVGSWAGASAITWAKALQRFFHEGEVTCVDTWQPYIDPTIDASPMFEVMTQAARDGSIYQIFRNNLRAAGVEDMVRVRVGASSEVLSGFLDENFHVIYIDGSHKYEDVALDLANAKRLVAPGGIVCGDDLELQLEQVDRERNAAGVRAGHDTIVDAASNLLYHPGVTLAVAEAFGPVGAWSGFWATQRDGSEWRTIDLSQCSITMPDHLDHLPQLIEEHRGFNVIRLGRRYCAVRQSLGPVDVGASEDELSRKFSAEDLFFADSRDNGKARIDAIEALCMLNLVQTRLTVIEQGPGDPTIPELTDAYCGFNIVRMGRRYYAMRQALGPVDLSLGETALSHRYKATDLFATDTADTARARIDVIELRNTIQRLQEHLEEFAPPVQKEAIEEYRGFNITRAGRHYAAIRQSLGPTDVGLGEDELRRAHVDGEILFGQSPDALKARIDARAVEEEMKRIKGSLVFRALRKIRLL